MKEPFQISDDIRKAYTLPGAFYRESAWFDRAKERLWAASWHYAADAAEVDAPGKVVPFVLLPGVLDEPLLLARDRHGTVRCLSNVCTHRAKVIVEAAGSYRQLTCSYHGRCFDLDGRFRRMPGFQEVEDFPGERDHLAQISMEEWLGLCLVSLQPTVGLEEMVRPMWERLSWLPLNTLTYDPENSKDYFVQAHWALYCDNYLEGFHIPFVHPALNQALDFSRYAYELFPYCNLQLGIADEGQPCFDPPAGHPDAGKRVFAYYFWLFPNLMFNFYPWGLSLNVVEPLAPDRTLVRFRTYRFADAGLQPAEAQLHQTELEDEAVVESVQKGIRSRHYDRGRYSVSMEPCVHHFHRLIAQSLC